MALRALSMAISRSSSVMLASLDSPSCDGDAVVRPMVVREGAMRVGEKALVVMAQRRGQMARIADRKANMIFC